MADIGVDGTGETRDWRGDTGLPLTRVWVEGESQLSLTDKFKSSSSLSMVSH